MSRARIERGLDELIRVTQASKSLSDRVVDLAGRYIAALRGGWNPFLLRQRGERG